MRSYETKNLRNVAITGHSGSGKTSLAEALLYVSKSTDRKGKIEDGTTICDFDSEEKKRKISINTAIAPLEWQDTKINIIDVPGYFDFAGEILEGLRASDIAIINVCGVSGIQVGTNKAWEYTNKNHLPRAFFINKLDRENSSFEKALKSLKDTFGISVVPVQYPIGNQENFKGIVNVISRVARIYNPKTGNMEKSQLPDELLEDVDKCKNMIVEAVAQTDEKLMNEYFETGTLKDKEIYDGLINGCVNGDITPVMCGSALFGIGMNTLLEDIMECFPSPNEINPRLATDLNKNEEIKININENKPFSAFVFKTIADPFVGKLSLFKVMTGSISPDSAVYNSNKDKVERIGNLYFIKGKEQKIADKIIAGDLGAVSKLQYTNTGDTLCDSNFKIKYNEIIFPKPMLLKTIFTDKKGDEDKILSSLNKLSEEDSTFKIYRDVENAETIIAGLGVAHLDIIVNKLKNKFGVDAKLRDIKIPYRETIKKSVEVQGKHKKQSGGHGQYGDVKIKFEPGNQEDLEFVDEVVGGAVPRQYIPAVEKGLRKCIKEGILANYPVINLKATLNDGSYHSVDSSEMAFEVAASLAYKKGMKEANPILLEPIMNVEIVVPDECMGDIMSDINKKRGKILGMDQEGRNQKIVAEIPQAELLNYATDLKAMTGDRGIFDCKFSKYEEVPQDEALKIIENFNNKLE